MKFSHALVQDLVSEKAWPSLPPMGKAKQPITHRPSAWGKTPALGTTEAGGLAEALGRWVIIGANLAPANQAPPLTAVMTKAKAAPKIGSRRNSKGSGKKWSPKWRTIAAAADLDSVPEPQQPAQEAVPVPDLPTTAHEDAKEETDAGEVTSQKSDEKKEDKHEKKEDKHEEKTESNHQEIQDGGTTASASGSQHQEPIPCQESSSEHGESRNEGKKDDVSVTGDTVSSTVAGLEAEETEEFPKACWDVF